jgi:hypothetical protein
MPEQVREIVEAMQMTPWMPACLISAPLVATSTPFTALLKLQRGERLYELCFE